MANNNSALGAAKNAKKDEFYTQLSDIEKELRHYRKHFAGKTVLCNCDDPFESNFFKYFVLNFNRLGLKKLIATCYVDSPIMGSQLQYCIDGSGQMSFSFGDEPQASDENKKPYKAVVTKVYDKTGNGGVDMLDIAELFKSGDNALSFLNGDGDFRSEECIELLKEADIVVTNPPFSLFREYVAQLMEYDKKFIIIGNQNAITYKEIFTLIASNKVWLGFHSGHTLFAVPDDYSIPDFYDKNDRGKLRSNGYIVDENGKLWRNLGNICWFTNLDIKKRHEELILVKKYDPDIYQKFDNYDAINVNAVADIPCDYDGVMGVPITFPDKYNPDQFEIIGLIAGNIKGLAGIKSSTGKDGPYIDGKLKYGRILIRNRHPESREENRYGN